MPQKNENFLLLQGVGFISPKGVGGLLKGVKGDRVFQIPLLCELPVEKKSPSRMDSQVISIFRVIS